jgi:hypothetical protein
MPTPTRWQVIAAGRQQAAVSAASRSPSWIPGIMPLRARRQAVAAVRHRRVPPPARRTARPRPEWGALRALRRWLQARGALMPEDATQYRCRIVWSVAAGGCSLNRS